MEVISPKAHGLPRSPASPDWEEVLSPVRDFLARVSSRMEDQVAQFEPEIAEHARYALQNQGKQLRPALVALAAGAIGDLRDEHCTIAMVVEMVHLATLVHDDIMDGASVRRNRPTVGSRWGNHLAVLLGDCLFAHAMKAAAALPADDIFRSLAVAASAVCTGEILQSNRRRRWNLRRADYLRMLELKTAELFAVATELGGRHAGASPAQQAALRRYGLAVGTAYQIYDDCLDLFGSERTAGKSLGTDLATGKMTLPLILLLEQASPSDHAEILGWLERWDPSYSVGLRALLEQHGCLAASGAVIEEFLHEAREALEGFPRSRECTALDGLARLIGHQTALLGP
ncbi:MAG: polyprenyl synthetase family protein [Verrucomicrobiae bacterium]|nr:polyprenyl synthetase family protein [Verrucomicrobiae bacterium]